MAPFSFRRFKFLCIKIQLSFHLYKNILQFFFLQIYFSHLNISLTRNKFCVWCKLGPSQLICVTLCLYLYLPYTNIQKWNRSTLTQSEQPHHLCQCHILRDLNVTYQFMKFLKLPGNGSIGPITHSTFVQWVEEQSLSATRMNKSPGLNQLFLLLTTL